MTNKSNLSIGTLKAASLLMLVYLIFFIVRLTFSTFMYKMLSDVRLGDSGIVMSALKALPPSFSEMLLNNLAISNKLLPTMLTVTTLHIVFLAIIYAIFHFAIKNIKMNRSLKKWAIMVLLASAFIISARSGFLLAIGALGVFAGANMMIQVEEKH